MSQPEPAPIRFIWDASKAASNRRKHKVTFEEAVTIFADPRLFLAHDTQHSDDEDRTIAIGHSDKLRVLFVVHIEVDRDLIRIISARKAAKPEQRIYEAGQF
ncbi:MAG: BrnT family toxin [Phycisphaerales bacterium]|jgi:hypothetical protein|nr:BrnT family toxin [Phycisphaerales bacterium]